MEQVFAIDDRRDTIEHDAIAGAEIVGYAEVTLSQLFASDRGEVWRCG